MIEEQLWICKDAVTIPFAHYGDLQSREAIQYADEILEFVRTQMA